MRLVGRLASLAAIAVVALAAPACSKKAKKVVTHERRPSGGGALAEPTADDLATAPRRPVGAFTVPVPSSWKDVSATEATRPDQLALQTTVRQPPVTLVISPALEPAPFDPGDPRACDASGRTMPGVVGAPSVLDLPPGKACVIETDDHGRMTMYVIANPNGKGVMAQCRFERPGDHGACDAIIRAIAPQ